MSLSAISETKTILKRLYFKPLQRLAKEKKLAVLMDTHFNEALRKIEHWQKTDNQQRLPKLQLFTQELQEKHPEYTMNKMIEGLKTYREDAMQKFKETYRSVLGTEFTYEKGNLLEILKDLLSNPGFRTKYAGLLVIFDEFGYTLNDRRVSIPIMQGFAQLCAQGWREGDKSTANLVFLGTAHRSLKEYSRPDDKADFDVLSDRITEIGLTYEGMEKIIGAIVVPKRTSELWLKQVAPSISVFHTFIPECKRIPIFKELDAAALHEDIFEKIYPMHPMATYCLLKLAVEVGSNNRTVFTFFSGGLHPGDQSYPYYAQANQILDEQNNLNLYSTDLLYSYFKENLRSDIKDLKEATRRKVHDYEATVRELNKVARNADLENSKNAERILRTMLIYEIVGVKNDLENITFALYPKSAIEKAHIKLTLEKMHSSKVLYFNIFSKAFEFRQSNTVDFNSLIEAHKRDNNYYPTNIAQTLDTELPLAKAEIYLDAKGYNNVFNEDKRVKRKLASVADLESTENFEGEKVDFFTSLQRQLDVFKDWKDSYDGWAVYVLCQNNNEIQKAQKSAEKNKSKRIMVVIPQTPTNWIDLLLDYSAVKSIQGSPEFETYSTQDKARLNGLMVDNALPHLQKAKMELLEGRNSTWYIDQGKILSDKIIHPSDAVDRCLEVVFEKRTRFKHMDLNLSNSAKYQPNKNIALKDAVNKILSSKTEIEVDSSYSQEKGEIRYLKNVLAMQGVLRQVGKQENQICKYQIESNSFKICSSVSRTWGHDKPNTDQTRCKN